MKILNYFIPVILALFISCEECTDCGPIVNEPSFGIAFYVKSVNKAARATLDTINCIPGKQVKEAFEDASTTFSLPLNYNGDTSRYDMTITEYSSDIEDTLTYTQYLIVAYSRETYVDNGEIKIRAFNFDVVDYDFDSLGVVNQNSSGISNETTIRLYL